MVLQQQRCVLAAASRVTDPGLNRLDFPYGKVIKVMSSSLCKRTFPFLSPLTTEEVLLSVEVFLLHFFF